METDYLAIAMVNKSGQLFFLSSNPSIEQNLIEKNLWSHDGSFSFDFIYQDQPKSWAELYDSKYASLLYQYKQKDLKLVTGLSIPSFHDEYRVVFSFGFKSKNVSLTEPYENYIEKLTAMGNYCLKEITQQIPMLDKTPSCKPKAKLRLIYQRKGVS